MERTWSNAFLSDSSWDCYRGKSSRSVRISLSTALRSPGAASAGPGSASPVRTAASPSGFSFPQEASTHKTPNKILNAGQLVPKISGCRRRGLTATSTLCLSAELGLADPASLAWALTAADSGAGPPLHRGWALGSTPARDLGRKDGGEKEEGGRERETEVRDSPTPWHAAIWSSVSWMARSSDVRRWHWTHCAVFMGNRAMNCSSTTRSMIWSTSLSPANSHLRHASRSW